MEKLVKWIFNLAGKNLSADVLIHAITDIVVYAVNRPELTVFERDEIIKYLIDFDVHIGQLIEKLRSVNAFARTIKK